MADLSLGLVSVFDDEASADAPGVHRIAAPALEEQTLLAMYRHMRQVRSMETRMVMLQRQGRVGFYGSCAGQEAPPIATGFAVEKSDWVFPALRESAIMLVRGFPLVKYLAQVYGNSLDVLKGRQMPSHMSGREVNQVSWSSCIGPQIPQAVGAAWAAKLKSDPAVMVGFMGDGATSQPDFHNAINFAGVFKLPVVLICQNNHWSISVPTSRQTASQTIAVKARAYGVPGVRVDGNDVLACYSVIRRAVELARSGGGATFIECVTYRMGAHSTSDDPTRYRSDAEVESWAKKDPVERFRKYLSAQGVLPEGYDESLEASFGAELSAAIEQVEAAAPPPPESIFEDVYATRPWHLEEQLAELRAAGPAPKAH
ncbi:MAG: thiamine pyrophosphate-dependent dehydrogenase E1 component subunit alpha [Polyangiaceae bacterium]|nr:thiamine pyrophosphate-dependent dehydrogenase E1 component subunit alpha [Polyangiaceae bacterium]